MNDELCNGSSSLADARQEVGTEGGGVGTGRTESGNKELSCSRFVV